MVTGDTAVIVKSQTTLAVTLGKRGRVRGFFTPQPIRCTYTSITDTVKLI